MPAWFAAKPDPLQASVASTFFIGRGGNNFSDKEECF
jgi:hypothetical protein